MPYGFLSEPSRLDEVRFVTLKVSKKQVVWVWVVLFCFKFKEAVFLGETKKFELLADTWHVDRCEKNLVVEWVAGGQYLLVPFPGIVSGACGFGLGFIEQLESDSG